MVAASIEHGVEAEGGRGRVEVEQTGVQLSWDLGPLELVLGCRAAAVHEQVVGPQVTAAEQLALRRIVSADELLAGGGGPPVVLPGELAFPVVPVPEPLVMDEVVPPAPEPFVDVPPVVWGVLARRHDGCWAVLCQASLHRAREST